MHSDCLNNCFLNYIVFENCLQVNYTPERKGSCNLKSNLPYLQAVKYTVGGKDPKQIWKKTETNKKVK